MRIATRTFDDHSAEKLSQCLNKLLTLQVSITARQRSALCVAHYLEEIAPYRPEQLVFCDESAVNEQSTWRKYGRSPSGKKANVDHDFKRQERLSLLPLFSIDGILTAEILQGLYNEESFLEWIENKAIPNMNAYPAPYSVLVLDNARIHNEERLQMLLSEKDIHLVFLPPYAPIYNPIEPAFHLMKKYLQRHYKGCSNDELPAALLASTFRAVPPDIAQALYRGCEIFYTCDEQRNEAAASYNALYA